MVSGAGLSSRYYRPSARRVGVQELKTRKKNECPKSVPQAKAGMRNKGLRLRCGLAKARQTENGKPQTRKWFFILTNTLYAKKKKTTLLSICMVDEQQHAAETNSSKVL